MKHPKNIQIYAIICLNLIFVFVGSALNMSDFGSISITDDIIVLAASIIVYPIAAAFEWFAVKSVRTIVTFFEVKQEAITQQKFVKEARVTRYIACCFVSLGVGVLFHSGIRRDVQLVLVGLGLVGGDCGLILGTIAVEHLAKRLLLDRPTPFKAGGAG